MRILVKRVALMFSRKRFVGESNPSFKKIPTVVDVSPGITRYHGQGRVVQEGESVVDVSAE